MTATSLLLVYLLSLPLFGGCAAVAQTVTLFDVIPTFTPDSVDTGGVPAPTPIYSVIGVDADGLTTYKIAWEFSEEYESFGLESVTKVETLSNGDYRTLYSYTGFTSTYPGRTHLATLVEGASQFKYAQDVSMPVGEPFDYRQNCHWDEDGKGYGECEVIEWHPSESILGDIITYTNTYTGTVQPFTVVISNTIPGPPSATSTSFGVRQAFVGVSTYVMIISSAAFFVLYGFI